MYIFRGPVGKPEDKKATPPEYRRTIENGMVIERDLAVEMRDGVKIYINLFRPDNDTPAAPLIAWGPYGKHGHTKYSVNFPQADVNDDHTSDYTAFEAPDPPYWVSRGYAVIYVDPRGTWYSEGEATYLSPEEAVDFYDLVEWAGTQPWSNGKVGLSGVSYLTSSQWRVAELHPPHLTAINPWEGWTDTYREVARHGGIPETSFWPYLPSRWGDSTTRVEDLTTETAEHPFYDDFWKTKTADFSKIEVPAFVVASWSDQGLHTRGTLEGFKHIASKQKWLMVHGRKKWAQYYVPECVRQQLAFFDHFLLGKDTELDQWAKVRLELREKYYVGDLQDYNEWPIADTQYTKLFLDAKAATLSSEPVIDEAQCSYASTPEAEGPGSCQFSHTFTETTELTGNTKLKLWMSSPETDDMDIFVAIQKLDRDGNIVPFPFCAQFGDGPVALGWLRASHRELDEQKSTPYQPVLAHQRELKLKQGEIIPLEIEIWPSSTRFEAGETLQLVVQGKDINDYPRPNVCFRHEDLMNVGSHIIHAGGQYDSHLLIPVIPD